MDNPIEEKAVLVTGPLTEEAAPGLRVLDLGCPKCNGPMVKCDIGYVGIYGWWLERTSRLASGLGPRRAVSSDVYAKACTVCGYTELYAKEPRALAVGEEAN
ncbi:MAG: hypothetical protein ACJ78Q_05170 [Chloroflexia bacterium]